jgi:hypothetical protein
MAIKRNSKNVAKRAKKTLKRALGSAKKTTRTVRKVSRTAKEISGMVEAGAAAFEAVLDNPRKMTNSTAKKRRKR